MFHVGKRSNRCSVGQKTEVDIKCYEMTFLRVKAVLLPLHFPQYDVNIVGGVLINQHATHTLKSLTNLPR